MIKVSIVGGSGYTGGDLLRILLFHPEVEIHQITSERHTGKMVSSLHPNLRKICKHKFVSIEELDPCDVLFLGLPHGQTMNRIETFENLADMLVDLSADFRIQDTNAYEKWYGKPHTCPEKLKQFVYGIPELNREKMKTAKRISGAGCNATATILALHPLYQAGVVESAVVEVKAGSSQGGNSVNEGSHHPERSGAVRSYKPTAHRHLGEIEQALSPGTVHFSATSIEMVRGILATCHVFLNQDLEEKDIWKIYRNAYGNEPFIRIVKERSGIHRYPEPKILAGSNYCDIGFERDPHSNRLVVLSAIDNLMKGAAGQAVQAFNIACGFDETTGLEFPGLHPA
ncbi:MAG: N-acetyl-gamma-glutamyl-phosphate/LysW-gamma-L-alpha-aminoadipyl-6-phosphate reductase [Gammaproteobacteria bacterium]|jgi:N-acetyl-gamma-glutamyl-phosphate/LysW-gamma-L-alpha-aminoadipyl-6-phosphate reductase